MISCEVDYKYLNLSNTNWTIQNGTTQQVTSYVHVSVAHSFFFIIIIPEYCLNSVTCDSSYRTAYEERFLRMTNSSPIISRRMMMAAKLRMTSTVVDEKTFDSDEAASAVSETSLPVEEVAVSIEVWSACR